ncbi:MAG TPA: SrtB family sortase [Ruminococcaceae bacterium]|nr:SrtB family sortase [Oscillospiraceae bacterium]
MKKRRIIINIAVIVILVGIVSVCFVRPKLREGTNSHLYNSLQSSAQATSKPSSTPVSNLSSIAAMNSDFKGWLQIPGTNISYPITQTSDNTYYLTHSYDKKNGWYGTPFIDFRDKLDSTPSQNLIIYGHNMGDDQMFHELVNYEDPSFYSKAPSIWFQTLNGTQKWKIFAAFYANPDANQGDVFYYLNTSFQSQTSFTNFTNECVKRSLFKSTVDLQANDRIMTLSTCSYTFNDARFVVMARLVRNGEDATDATAVKNPSPQMPQIWHKEAKSGIR